jgi:hypothetical protein
VFAEPRFYKASAFQYRHASEYKCRSCGYGRATSKAVFDEQYSRTMLVCCNFSDAGARGLTPINQPSTCYFSAATNSKLRGSGVECMGGAGMTSRPPSPMATRPIATRYVQGLTSTTPPICRRSRTILHHSLSCYSSLCQAAPNHTVPLSALAPRHHKGP